MMWFWVSQADSSTIKQPLIQERFKDRKDDMQTTRFGESIMYVILYACIITDEEDGLFVDHTFLGGIVQNKTHAEEVARDITNDKSIPGTTISKILSIESQRELPKVMSMTNRYFNEMANEMYDMEAQREK